MAKKDRMIGACGLLCNECDILKAKDNPEIAQKIADWFKKERDIEVKIEDIRCSGCKGDRTEHWSPDCWILKCCVAEKGLSFCYECKDFPCKRLTQWAKGSKGYKQALKRLKELKRK